MKAAIFMATYNGEHYISDQIESLISQTFKEWELFISDDMSTDNTLQILKEYQKRDPRISAIINNEKEHGAFSNYYNILRYVKKEYGDSFDYYFYCDQDDIWLPTKLEMEIQVLECAESEYGEIPLLCYSDLEIMDGDGMDTGKKLSDYTDIQLHNPYNIFFSHRYIWGTTMAHNKKLWNMLNLPENIPNCVSHDHYIGKYAVCFGKAIYIKEPMVLYRRHGANVSGVPHSYGLLEGVKRAVSKMPVIINNHGGTYWASLYFIEAAPYKTQFMEKYETAINQGGFAALKLFDKYKICPAENIFNQCAFKFILATSLYKKTKSFNREFDL